MEKGLVLHALRIRNHLFEPTLEPTPDRTADEQLFRCCILTHMSFLNSYNYNFHNYEPKKYDIFIHINCCFCLADLQQNKQTLETALIKQIRRVGPLWIAGIP